MVHPVVNEELTYIVSSYIGIRATKRFSVLHSLTLKQAALNILNVSDVVKKAHLTMEVVRSWNTGQISVITDEYSDTLSCPDEPGRPSSDEMEKMLRLSCPVVSDEQRTIDAKRIKTMLKKNTLECTVHGIANAESYAIDLFWDLIARFTNAAAAFPANDCLSSCGANSDDNHRQRVLVLPNAFYDDMTYIANQEAEHFLSWYHRLVELNCPFGTFPLSKGLWQSAGDTSGCILARLAIINLTHEAKGLDTYAKTREKFMQAGDTISASILDHNYQEEIYHVTAGLKWFKYLCNKYQLDALEQFHSLSRQYFKGKLKPPFNVEAREEAGLTVEWYMPLT